MVRLGRYFLPDQPLHVIQRGNNREAIFFAEADYDDYRGWLADAAAACGCAIHADVLMTNHVHLLVTPRRVDSLPRTMQSLGRRYVRHINANYRRTGTLWEGCYRAAPIDSEAYFLACCRYIELNPVRAGMVRIRAIIRGRATPPMHGERSIGWPIDTGCSTGSGRIRSNGGRRTRVVPRGARSRFCRPAACGHERRMGARRSRLQAADRHGARPPRRAHAQGAAAEVKAGSTEVKCTLIPFLYRLCNGISRRANKRLPCWHIFM